MRSEQMQNVSGKTCFNTQYFKINLKKKKKKKDTYHHHRLCAKNIINIFGREIEKLSNRSTSRK
jgi:hypothetical protein